MCLKYIDWYFKVFIWAMTAKSGIYDQFLTFEWKKVRNIGLCWTTLVWNSLVIDIFLSYTNIHGTLQIIFLYINAYKQPFVQITKQDAIQKPFLSIYIYDWEKKPPINDDDQMRVNVIVCVCNTCNTMLH